jgi:uncharacterized protein (DUF1499 family)
MLRRPSFMEEPKSRLAIWSSRCALFALAVVVLSIVIVRIGLLEIEPALATFAAGLVFAAFAILLAFASFVTIWRQGLDGLRFSMLGLFLGLTLLAYPGYLGYRASKLPMIADITTDPVTPPPFDVLARLRPRGSIDYPGAATARQQVAAYPDVVPLQVDLAPKRVYDIALNLVTKRKWLIVDTLPPSPTRRNGVIEAVARTFIMGFRDDVVIRVSADGDGTRVDMRSASRYGWHDFGANAARIRALLADIDDTVNALPEPPPTPAPPAKKAPAKRQRPKR